MKCSTCGEDTQVKRSRLAENGTAVARLRVCGKGHRFDTLERRRAHGLSEVLVRRSGDRRLAEGAFDRVRLLGDVRNGVLKRLGPAETLDAVNAAVGVLEVRLPTLLQPLSEEELAQRPGVAGAILDTDITDAVESELRHASARMAHVLYALYVRGRADRKGRRGWRSSVDVLGWLFEDANYPDLAAPVPASPDVPVDEWRPPAPAPTPDTVVKRAARAADPDRPADAPAGRSTRRFRADQFERSIKRAMLGRAGDVEWTSHCIAQWVLWGVAGQREVHTGQLAFGVLDCLRRVDDVAYLRWASIAKDIESVTAFRDEALSLITHPSPRLRFGKPAHVRPPQRPGAALAPKA